LREKLCLDNLLIFQCVDFLGPEAEVADQKIAEIMDIIHAALEGGRCIAVDATENGFACHGRHGKRWWNLDIDEFG
jgi:hypothetical protein